MDTYAKIIIKGSPITKSNFKLHNSNKRAILPCNSASYNDRYGLYEQEIAYIARSQNPSTVLEEGLIAILKVYYKSEKRHPDTINITKSIFDGIEKSGIIINDAQIRRILIEEYYDKENPRFELELFGESDYDLSFVVNKKSIPSEKKLYTKNKQITKKIKEISCDDNTCSICNKPLIKGEYISGNNGKTLICNNCFKKLF